MKTSWEKKYASQCSELSVDSFEALCLPRQGWSLRAQKAASAELWGSIQLLQATSNRPADCMPFLIQLPKPVN
jgi:hypothetical protein